MQFLLLFLKYQKEIWTSVLSMGDDLAWPDINLKLIQALL